MPRDGLRERVFRRMLERETGSDADAPEVAAAARRLYEHFARHLTALVGDAGVGAILARSLHLTQRQLSGLAPVRASDEAQEPFTRVQRFLEHQESAAAVDAAVAVLTTVCELLESFIGNNLTSGLLGQVWPDDFAGYSTQETAT
jgi:hypothetical protein